MDLDWDEEEVTRPSTALLPIVPINPRIRIIGSTQVLGSAPGMGADTPEPQSDCPASDSPETPRVEGDEFDERETTERDKVSVEAADEEAVVEGAVVEEAVEDWGVVVAPIVSVEGPPPSSRPTWDDMTVPRHARDLRDHARRLAALSKDDEPLESRQPSMRILSFDVAPPTTPDRAPGDDLPMTLPRESSISPPTSAAMLPPRSVDVDLSSVDGYADTSSPSQLSAPAETPQVLSGFEGDEEDVFPKPQTDWQPLEEHAVITAAPRARRPSELRSVPPVTMSSPGPSDKRRRGIAIAAFGVMLILCSTIFALWLFPKKGAVVVRLRTEDGHPAAKAEIYVDGQKRCDTDPCVIEGLARGDRTIKVIVPGSDEPRVANVEVRPGTQETVWIDVPSTVQAEEEADDEPDAIEPSLTVSLATAGARVVLIPEGGMGRVIEGPFPRTIDLPLGRYEIVASLSGYAPFVDHVALSDEAPTAEVDVRLVKRGGSGSREDGEDAKKDGEDSEEPRVQKHSPYWDPYADVEWD